MTKRERRRALARLPVLMISLLIVIGLACANGGADAPDRGGPPGQEPADGQGESIQEVAVQVETIASGLDTPWALAFAPDGRLFFTERAGRVRVIENGQLRGEPVAVLPDVVEQAESGLLGLALDPNFVQNRFVYLYYTYRSDGELRNRVVRYRENANSLAPESRQILLDNIPAASVHDGGRLAFGPDGKLYVTAGDAGQSSRAQDRAFLGGKILRLNPDGSIPGDNPFQDSPVYAYGLRNPQGLAWQPDTGRLYATDHGPTGNDELNLIERASNYGWPEAQGGGQTEPFRGPLSLYTQTVAPCGAVFYTGAAIPQWRNSLFFAALRGNHLHRIVLTADGQGIVQEERLYDGAFGRLRDVVQGPDGALYLSTSNRDGRGNPSDGDDKILRLSPR